MRTFSETFNSSAISETSRNGKPAAPADEPALAPIRWGSNSTIPVTIAGRPTCPRPERRRRQAVSVVAGMISRPGVKRSSPRLEAELQSPLVEPRRQWPLPASTARRFQSASKPSSFRHKNRSRLGRFEAEPAHGQTAHGLDDGGCVSRRGSPWRPYWVRRCVAF